MKPLLRRLVAVLAVGGLFQPWACGADLKVVLDRNTGTTLQVTSAPWILSFDQPLLAAHARDYVALYAVETSNAGKQQNFLAAFFWSTVPGHNRFAGPNPKLRLLLDDREVLLTPDKQSMRDSGISDWPMRPPGRDALPVLYAVDGALIRQLGNAERIRLRPEPADDLPDELWFEPWRDARRQFRTFAEKLISP